MDGPSRPTADRIAALAAKCAEIATDFEKHFKVGPDGFSMLAPTGEPYITVLDSGVRAEGELTGPHPFTPEHAIIRWIKVVAKIINDAPEGCTIYWRTRPELGEHDGQWRVYSRFLISNKPAKGD